MLFGVGVLALLIRPKRRRSGLGSDILEQLDKFKCDVGQELEKHVFDALTPAKLMQLRDEMQSWVPPVTDIFMSPKLAKDMYSLWQGLTEPTHHGEQIPVRAAVPTPGGF